MTTLLISLVKSEGYFFLIIFVPLFILEFLPYIFEPKQTIGGSKVLLLKDVTFSHLMYLKSKKFKKGINLTIMGSS